MLDYAKACAILEGYRQFLAIKVDHKDWDGKQFSPCFLVHALWEVHSEMGCYENDMKLLCGRPVQYNSEDEEDVMVLAARQQAAIEAISGKHDESVWNAICVGVCRAESRDDDSSDDSSDDYPIPFFYQDKTTPLTGILEQWAEGEGVSVGDFNFFYDRKLLT